MNIDITHIQSTIGMLAIEAASQASLKNAALAENEQLKARVAELEAEVARLKPAEARPWMPSSGHPPQPERAVKGVHEAP